jgi:hypothetical protein
MNAAGLSLLIVGSCLRYLRWRRGTIELIEEKLVIEGSYDVSIWLRNMWTINFLDNSLVRRVVRIDSKTDAVQIKFTSEQAFATFAEELVKRLDPHENAKINRIL